MLRLHCVTVECQFFVAIEDGARLDQFKVANLLEKELDSGDMAVVNFNNQPVKKLDDVPDDWLTELPLTMDSKWHDKTCEDIVVASMEADEKAAYLKPMPNQTSLPLSE